MAIRNVVQVGDDILKKKCRPVEAIDDKIKRLLDDMIDTMRDYDGVGLAAPQVGMLKRIFVVEVEDQIYEMINPEILETKGAVTEEEGCLSVLGKVGTVTRPEYVKIKGQNRDGQWVEIEATGLLAKAFSHEHDHLEGVLYTDKATNMRSADE